MRAVIVGCVSFLVGLLVFGVFPRAAPAQTVGTPGRFVVVFASATIPPGAQRLIESAGGAVVEAFPEVGIAVAVSDSVSFAARVGQSAMVESVGEERTRPLPTETIGAIEPDAVGPVPCTDSAPCDRFYPLQWNIRRVRADAAWAVTTGSSDVVVAVIDNGVASNHPDLAPNLNSSQCFESAWSVGTMVRQCSRLYPEILFPEGSHGTLVAGIIAAAFGHGRVVGVGPNLKLASYNVFELDPTTGQHVAFESSIWAAMMDAAQPDPITGRPKARVINLSLGDLILRPQDNALWKAWNRVAEFVTRRGVTIVASAGNGNVDLNGPAAHVPSDLPSVIGVGATVIRPRPEFPQVGAFDLRAFYGNFGAALTLVAPGGDCGPNNPECSPSPPALLPGDGRYLVVSSAVNPGFVVRGGHLVFDPTCITSGTCAIGYASSAGTSFAAPHVTGVVGLILSQNPGLNPHQVAAILKRTAQPLGDRQQFGHGMVDAAAAVGAP